MSRRSRAAQSVVCPLSGFEVAPGGPRLAERTIDRLRVALMDEKRRLLDHSQRLAEEAAHLAGQRAPIAEQLDDSAPEADMISVERDRLITQAESTHALVSHVDQALERMRDGRYGTCVPAGRKLPVARLRAIPWAEVCVDCQEHASRRR